LQSKDWNESQGLQPFAQTSGGTFADIGRQRQQKVADGLGQKIILEDLEISRPFAYPEKQLQDFPNFGKVSR
jgi:hypothetical protein